MPIFNKDMVELTERNDFFQKEVYRDAKVQIVLMNLPAGEDIGMETHAADQTTFFVSGEGQAIVDGHATKVSQRRRAQHRRQGRRAAEAVQRLRPARRAGRRGAQDQGRCGSGGGRLRLARGEGVEGGGRTVTAHRPDALRRDA